MRTPVVLAVFPPAAGAINFARDDALLAFARAGGQHAIRLYSWDRPTVSFGRNERVQSRFLPERLTAAGLDALRRPTGGRALLHHREFTYAIAGPAVASEPLRETYQRVNTLLADALQRMGANAEIAPRTSHGPAADGAFCFAAPSPGELTVGGRKLVASAQWRNADAFLQHGSILIDDDQTMLRDAVTEHASRAPLAPPATLREVLARTPTIEELASALSDAIIATGAAFQRIEPEAMFTDADIRTRAEHYRDPAWTWRR